MYPGSVFRYMQQWMSLVSTEDVCCYVRKKKMYSFCLNKGLGEAF